MFEGFYNLCCLIYVQSSLYILHNYYYILNITYIISWTMISYASQSCMTNKDFLYKIIFFVYNYLSGCSL